MRTLLAIPVYNESRHVGDVLAAVQRYVDNILVVDDGSTDDTASVLAGIDNVRVIRHRRNQGYGQSLVDAFNYAICHEMDWVITMDCDGQHEPESLPRFLSAAAADDCDIVSGSRYLPGDGETDSPPADRRAINGRITRRINDVLGLGISDAFCGFKAYRVSRLGALNLTEAGYAMPLQLWVHAARQGLRIREIPVRLIYNDPNRSFGGPLDDPEYRMGHYLHVLNAALREPDGVLNGCHCGIVREQCCRC